MKLNLKEKNFLENIVSLSALDKKYAKMFFRSLLAACSMAVYAEENEIIIPYICKLKIDHAEKDGKTKIYLKAEPREELIKEVTAIIEGKEPPSKKFSQKEIFEEIKNKIDVDDIDLEIEF